MEGRITRALQRTADAAAEGHQRSTTWLRELSMIGEGIASILGLLQALLEDRAKNLLRGKTSDAKAKALSFRLYKQIKEVAEQSRGYVKSLSDLSETLRRHSSVPGRGHKDFASTPEGSEIMDKASAVNRSIGLLTAKLADLQEITGSMRTQLSIYTPDLLEKVESFNGSRDADAEEVSHYLVWKRGPESLRTKWPRYLLSCKDELWDLYVGANQNQLMIEDATKSLRTFLAEQFTFRESF